MADTFNKKSLQQKRAKKKQDKLEKKEERKLNNNKGKSLDDMIVYLDEEGNITDIPPHEQVKKSERSNRDYNNRNNSESNSDELCTGTLSLYFVDKGYGFITEDYTRASIFAHNNKFNEPLKEKDRVSYKKEKTPKGFNAIQVSKIK
jgi:CspA family cold shock protein